MRSSRLAWRITTLLSMGACAWTGAGVVSAETIVVEPGGVGRVLRLPIEHLATEGEIQVEAAWSTTDVDGVWIGIVGEDDGRLTMVRAFDPSRPQVLFLMIQASRDARQQQLEGVVSFRRQGVVLAHGPFTVVVRPPPALFPVSLWAGGVLAVVVFMASGMLLNTRLLPPPRLLAEHFQPIRRTSGRYREKTDELRRADLNRELEHALSPANRWRNWWRSKPFRFMVPGRLYREALRLTPESAQRLNPALVEDANVVQRLDQAVDLWRGSLYVVATAWRGVEIVAVPSRSNRVGRLSLGRSKAGPWFRLSKSTELAQESDPSSDPGAVLRVTP